MRISFYLRMLIGAVCCLSSVAFAQPPSQTGSGVQSSAVQKAVPPSKTTPSLPPPTVPVPSFDLKHLRRIYVPEKALGALLKADQMAAVMPLSEFEKLVASARSKIESGEHLKRPPVLTSAVYRVHSDADRLFAKVTVQIQTSHSRSEVDLNVSGWNVEAGQLDGQTAPLARVGKDLNTLRLFVSDAGAHELQLELSSPLKTVGNDQYARLGLIAASTSRFLISLPAKTFLRVDGNDPGRPTKIDQPAEYDLPVGGLDTLEFTLSDRQQASRADILSFASTAYGVQVEPSEITWSARTELQIFGQSIDRLVCRVPQSLEVTRVESEGLQAWELKDEPEHPGQVTITLSYQKPFEGNRSITIRGVLSDAPDQPWNVPALEISKATAQTGVVLIRHPAQVRLQNLESKGARAVAQPHGKPVSPDHSPSQLMYEVWQSDFRLRFVTSLKEHQVQAAMTNLLLAGDDGIDLSITLSLQSRQAPLFDARLRIPAEYRVQSVLLEGRKASWDIVAADAGVNEVRIPLTPPLMPGQTRTVAVLARVQPEKWPVKSEPVVIALPEVRLPQAAMIEALYGIAAPEDLELVPLQLTGLDPAGQKDLELLNTKLQQSGQQIRLGFTYQDTVFQGQLQITRKPTLFVADSVTLFRVDRETVFSRIAARLSLSGGGLRQLSLQMSESAGDRLRFRLIPTGPGTVPAQLVEQLPGDGLDGVRTWTLNFDRYLQGDYVLVTEVQQQRDEVDPLSPPHLTFPQANAQSGYLAIEGAPDQQVRVTAQTAEGQPLPSVDPVDLPERAGITDVTRIVAGFRFVSPDWNCTVSTTQFDHEAIPSAIGHSNEIVSVWSDGGAFQHQANFSFTAFGMQSLLVQLPNDSSLWSTLLDGQPVESRRIEQGIQVSLTGLDPQKVHTLSVFYDTISPPRKTMGQLHAKPPRLSVISGNGDVQPLTVLKQSWELHYPDETVLIDSQGEFRPSDSLRSETWLGRLRERIHWPREIDLFKAIAILAVTALGLWLFRFLVSRVTREVAWPSASFLLILLLLLVGGGYLLLPAVQNAREAARSHTGNGAPLFGETEMLMEGAMSTSEPVPADARPHEEFKDQNISRLHEGNRNDELSTIRPDAKLSESREPAFRKPSNSPVPSLAPKMPADKDKSPATPLAAAGKEAPAAQDTASEINEGQQLGESVNRDEAAKERKVLATGGLLSMTFGLAIPDQTRSQLFEYDGNAAANTPISLDVSYENRTSNRVLILALAFGVALQGWWLRNSSVSLKLFWGFLTIVVPVAALGLIESTWMPAAQGVLFGGLATVLGWLLISCRCCLNCERSPLLCWVRNCCPLMAASCMIAMGSSTLLAEDRTSPPQPVPPAPHVIIPFESIDSLPSANRVWVPEGLFKHLRDVTHPDDAAPNPASVPYTIAKAEYVAKLVPHEKQYRVELQVRWEVVNLSDHAQTVPLPMQNRRLLEATLDGKPADLISQKDGGLAVVIPDHGVHVLSGSLIIPDQVSLTEGKFELNLLPVAASRLTLEIPSGNENLTLRVNNVSGSWQRTTTDKITRFQIPIDRGGKVGIAWRVGTKQPVEDRLLLLDTALNTTVEDAGIQMNHSFRLQVRKGKLNEILFNVPEDLALRQVTGAEIGGWEIKTRDGQKQLKVSFNRPILNQTQFRIDLFRSHQLTTASETILLEGITPLEVGRETGFISLNVPDHLRLRIVKTESLQQIDVAQVMPTDKSKQVGAHPQYAFKFISRPIRLTMEVARREAEVRGTVEHGIQVERRKVMIASRILLNLSGAPRRLLEIALPQNYLTMDVVCAHASDWYVTPSGDQQRLTIELDQPRTGDIEIGLEGHLVKNPEDEQISLSVPHPADAARATIQLGVWFDETYQAALSQSGNWKSIDTQQLPDTIRRLRPQPVQFAFQTNTKPTPLQFRLQRSVPTLNADAGILIAVGDATIDYGLTLRWKIANAAADTFVVTVPNWLGNLEFTGPGVRQVRSVAAGEERTRWIISLIDPVREQYLITAAATIGSPTDLTVRTPRLQFESESEVGTFASIQTQRQFAVLVNLSNHQLVPADLSQFESISVDQLPLAMPPALVQQAMEIVRVREDKIPTWTMQRMQQTIGAQAVVSAATLTTILQMDGSWRTQAHYGVRNRGQQFLALKLPEKSRLLSVFVRGEASRSVVTKLNGEPVHLIALPQTSAADLSFDVLLLLAGELQQRLPDQFSLRGSHIQMPAPQVVSPQESPELGLTVAQTLWNVFVPDELIALPVKEKAATNVTFHRNAGWIGAQLQSIERIRADIAEMKRIASDKQASYSQRERAQKNLIQLRTRLQAQSGFDSSSGYVEESLPYQIEKQKALSAVEDALQSLEVLKEGRSGAKGHPNVELQRQQASPSLGVGNRVYIQQSNLDSLSANSLTLEKTHKKESDALGLNFYKPDDARRSGTNRKKQASEESVARSKLKRQLQQQAPVIQSQSDVANGVTRRNRSPSGQIILPKGDRNQGEAEGMAGGMGGGIGGLAGQMSGRGINPSEPQSNPDVPFRQGSFDIPAPAFGGVARNEAGVSRKGGYTNYNAYVPDEIVMSQITTQGLSVAMTLPRGGNELSFDKLGGNPVLTLNVRPKRTWSRLLGILWCVGCLWLGIWLLRGLARDLTFTGLVRVLSILAVLLGGMFFLIGPMESRWLFFLIFCLSGIILALMPTAKSRRPAVEST